MSSKKHNKPQATFEFFEEALSNQKISKSDVSITKNIVSRPKHLEKNVRSMCEQLEN